VILLIIIFPGVPVILKVSFPRANFVSTLETLSPLSIHDCISEVLIHCASAIIKRSEVEFFSLTRLSLNILI
jgi:hypothetical protein